MRSLTLACRQLQEPRRLAIIWLVHVEHVENVVEDKIPSHSSKEMYITGEEKVGPTRLTLHTDIIRCSG